GKLQRGRDRRVHQAHQSLRRRQARGPYRKGRQRYMLQLPPRPCPRDNARRFAEGVRRTQGTAFERKTGFLAPVYVCFTVYDAQFEGVEIAFPEKHIKNTLGEYLASLGKKQLRIAETEKYAHVTFFFNGGV